MTFTRGREAVKRARWNVGDLVLVERGRNKATCQVIWAADLLRRSAGSSRYSASRDSRRGKTNDADIQIEDQYQPLILMRARRASLSMGE